MKEFSLFPAKVSNSFLYVLMKELDQLLYTGTNFVPLISPFASADLTMSSGGQTFKSQYRSYTFESAFITVFKY